MMSVKDASVHVAVPTSRWQLVCVAVEASHATVIGPLCPDTVTLPSHTRSHTLSQAEYKHSYTHTLKHPHTLSLSPYKHTHTTTPIPHTHILTPRETLHVCFTQLETTGTLKSCWRPALQPRVSGKPGSECQG